jgi:hypothetical protein
MPYFSIDNYQSNVMNLKLKKNLKQQKREKKEKYYNIQLRNAIREREREITRNSEKNIELNR